MTDDQHGEGTPPQGGHGGWERLPQGDYDDGATTFVQLPEGGIDALLAANSPLAAPGQGYVPPPITVAPATTGTDPAATGTWTMPAEGAQWPDPNAVPQGTAGHEHAYGYQPGGAGQWAYGEPGRYDENGRYEESGPYEEPGQEGPAAPGHDVTGQWSIPVAGGELPDESGEFTQSSLVEQWGGTPPATLPGGAPAPWATESIGTAWTAPPQERTGEPGYPGGAPDAYAGEGHVGDAPRAPQEAPGEPSAAPYADGRGEMPGEAPEGAQEAAGDSAAPSAPTAPEPPVFPQGADPTETLRFPAISQLPKATAAPETHEPHEAPGAPDAPEATDTPVGATEAVDAVDIADAVDIVDVTEAPEVADAAEVTGTPAQPETVDADADDRPAAEGEPAAADGFTDIPEAPDAPDAPVAPAAPTDLATGEPAAEPSPAAHDDHPLASYVLRVNGTDRPVADAWIGESLLYVLRERLGLAGAKDGCSEGECGACNVQVEGRLVASCLVPAVTAAGSEVRTVEGLAEDGQPSDVQRALAKCGAVQCGFCVPGMAMTVHDLLEGNPAPTELETRAALCGNLCRCSGYRGVLEAVREVVAEREAHTADGSGAAQDTGEMRIPHQAGPGAGGVNPAAHEDPSRYEDPSGYDPQGRPPHPPEQHDQSYGQDGGGQA